LNLNEDGCNSFGKPVVNVLFACVSFGSSGEKGGSGFSKERS